MLVVPTGAALVGATLPYTGLAHLLGFTPLPTAFFLLLFGMVVVYLLLVELAKTRFYRTPHARSPRMVSTHSERLERRIRRRVSRFVHFVAPISRIGNSDSCGSANRPLSGDRLWNCYYVATQISGLKHSVVYQPDARSDLSWSDGLSRLGWRSKSLYGPEKALGHRR